MISKEQQCEKETKSKKLKTNRPRVMSNLIFFFFVYFVGTKYGNFIRFPFAQQILLIL